MKTIRYLFFIALLCNKAFGQTTAPDLQTSCATSFQAQAGGYTISYTVGEMVAVQTLASSNLIITQGIMQPDVGVADTTGYGSFNDDEIRIFPNPTPDLLSLRLSLLKPGSFTVQLFDVSGRILQTENITYTTFTTRQYRLGKYAAATYLLKVEYQDATGKDKRKGIYKIEKTN